MTSEDWKPFYDELGIQGPVVTPTPVPVVTKDVRTTNPGPRHGQFADQQHSMIDDRIMAHLSQFGPATKDDLADALDLSRRVIGERLNAMLSWERLRTYARNAAGVQRYATKFDVQIMRGTRARSRRAS